MLLQQWQRVHSRAGLEPVPTTGTEQQSQGAHQHHAYPASTLSATPIDVGVQPPSGLLAVLHDFLMPTHMLTVPICRVHAF